MVTILLSPDNTVKQRLSIQITEYIVKKMLYAKALAEIIWRQGIFSVLPCIEKKVLL